MIQACTIIAANQLAAARVLAGSFFTHHPGGAFTVLVVDDESRQVGPDGEIDRRVSWWRLADLGLDTTEIHKLAAIYDADELRTAVKPLFLKTLLRAHGSSVIHLDPDGRVFDSLEDVAHLAAQHGIVLTPHLTEPIPEDGLGIDARAMLAAGLYNLGFVAVAPPAERCLEWWWQQTRRRALDGVPSQQALTDQRTTDYIPSLFDHHLLKDPGCNAAYWNLHERPLTHVDGRVCARGVPLRYFHFSGFDPKAPWLLSRHQGERPRIVPGEHPAVAALCVDYAAALDRAGLTVSSQRRYGWAVSAGGADMTRPIRRQYHAALAAAERGEGPEPPDPFDAAHPDAFTAWLNPSGRPLVTAPPITWVTAKTVDAPPPAPPFAPVATAPRSSRRDLTVALVIGLCCLIVYNANGRAITSGDTYAARYQPFALWKYHTLFLDPIEGLVAQGRELPKNALTQSPGSAYWIVPLRDGHLASLYPAVVPVLVAPLYAPVAGYLSLRGWTDLRVDIAARIMEKLVASSIAALSVTLLFLALRRRTTMSNAVLLAVAYAFGTSTWVISSQALWQHGMAQLLLAGAILLVTGPFTTARGIAVGVLCGLIAANRPPDAVLAGAIGLCALFWAGRRAALVIAAAAVPALLVVLYNVSAIGPITGAYGLLGRPRYFLRHDMASGLAGLLFSPTRGVFVFSPFLAFLVLIWRHVPRDRAELRLTIAMAGAIVVQVLLYSLTDWRAGMAWGPRFLTDMLPMLIWLLVPVVAALGRPGRACFVATVCVAVAIESIGAFTYTGVTDTPILSASNLRAAWQWQNAPFIAPISRGLVPPELLRPMRGSLDVVEADGDATDTISTGQSVVVRGWALAGQDTPLQVAITVDGRQTTAVRTFMDRADVRGVFPGSGPSGWVIPLDTTGLGPGPHRLSLYSWGSEQTDSYFLGGRTVTVEVKDGDLAASAKTAAARIRDHQQEPGYWLTAFTGSTRFEQPRDEMNTFLTSLLVDLIDPLPTAAGLGDSVRRARTHLTEQIEAGGLVRYHGLPDGPGIGRLGCAITPDADNTALVWRIAPAQDSERRSAALRTLETYRRNDGLYRTWLAARGDYQCLDPGGDPNPADIAIQMHVLQFLLDEQPQAGHALCRALGPRMDDERIWVYYRQTPLVPMLRTADTARAGCRLTLPASHMRTDVPGQDIWISLVQLLLRAEQPGGPRPDAAEITQVLTALSRGDFALLRQHPPLLYHNDLTATVPRFYWSEDAGYALWLRLAAAARIVRVQ